LKVGVRRVMAKDEELKNKTSNTPRRKGAVKKDLFANKEIETKVQKTAPKGSVKKDIITKTNKLEVKEDKPVNTAKTVNDTQPSKVEKQNVEKSVSASKKTSTRKEEVAFEEKSPVKEIKTRATKTKKIDMDIPLEDLTVEEVDSISESLKAMSKTAESRKTEVEELSDDSNTMQVEDNEEKKPKTRTKKKTQRDITIEDYNTNYVTKTLSQTIHDSMIPYSEFVIMDRALPRVEDGLKPVQRRVLYSMLEVGVLPDRPFKKSASIVGECMGKYHPHGDSSIYETLVRMAQPFNMREPLVNGHGNFGSVDGDSAAAMRYTEAKLTPLALELLRDLEKDTVTWGLNFDDRLKEPNTLPGRFPNLLVNGCQGIAVGLATNIPTHNLAEACNAVIAYIDNRNITLKELMKIMPAPDFPSGGYILNSSELEQVYRTGKGKIYIRSKISIENADNGRKNIVINEIPYQVNKANMLMKIAKYRDANPNGPLSGIAEIVDESDRLGTRAVIKLKKDAKINAILNTLYKYCDVQTTFGANIVAIADGKPKQMGLIEIIEYYVNYQQKIIYNRTNYDLEEALKKEHVLEGLLIAIRNIDEVVRIIKSSKSVIDAKIKLISTFELSEIQAQAILDMRLARLTNLEVNKLITDLNRLRDLIKRYTAIIKSPALQMKVVKSELQDIIKEYGSPRKTKFLSAEEHFEDSSSILDGIENETEDIQTFHLITTPVNTLKLVNLKSYNLVSKELGNNPTTAEIPSTSFKVDDNKDVYVFTNRGDSVKLPIKSIAECKFRDKGTPLFNLAKNVVKDENIVSVLELDASMKDTHLIFVTKMGMVKISKVTDYLSSKQVITAIKLAKGDEVVSVEFFNPDKRLVMLTSMGNGVKIKTEDMAISSRTSQGVKGMALEKTDYVVSAKQVAISDAFTLFLSDGSAKIIKQGEIADSARNRKGLSYISAKSKNANLLYAGRLSTKVNYVIETLDSKLIFIRSNALPIDTRTGNGKVLVKEKVKRVYPFVES